MKMLKASSLRGVIIEVEVSKRTATTVDYHGTLQVNNGYVRFFDIGEEDKAFEWINKQRARCTDVAPLTKQEINYGKGI